MSTVYAKPGESIESLLKRFKKVVERSGVLSDLKKHEFFEKPSVQKKRKQAAARKREQKRQMKMGKVIVNRNLNFKFNKDHTQRIPLNKPKVQNFQSNNRPNNTNRPTGEGYKKPYDNRNNTNKPSGEGYKKPYDNSNRSNYKKPYNNNNRPNSNYKPQNKDRK
jgi:small subunit ribosomal protein S21